VSGNSLAATPAFTFDDIEQALAGHRRAQALYNIRETELHVQQALFIILMGWTMPNNISATTQSNKLR
jgi:hypothetical protein